MATTQSSLNALARLNDLFRLELDTVDAYREAYDRFNPGPLAMELYSIEEAHEDAIHQLSDEITRCGGEPMPSELGWGLLSRLKIELTSLFQQRDLLEILREREATELQAYERAIKEGAFPSLTAETLRFLATQERHHLSALDHALRAA